MGCAERLVSLHGSCTRRRLQRLSYMLQEGMGLPTRYRFRNVHGASSDELDAIASELKFTGTVREEPEQRTLLPSGAQDEPGLTEWLQAIQGAPGGFVALVDRAHRAFGDLSDFQVHRISQVLFAHLAGRGPEKDKDQVLKTAQGMMPKVEAGVIQEDYRKLQELGMLDGRARQSPVSGARGTLFVVEAEDALELERLQRALDPLGTVRAHTAAGNTGGHMLTDSTAALLWQHQTGAGAEETGPYRGERKTWEQLGREQRDAFVLALGRAAAGHAGAAELLRHSQEFSGVALEPPGQSGEKGKRFPASLMRYCRAEQRETVFTLDPGGQVYQCGCGRSAAGAGDAVRELEQSPRMPASLQLHCRAENALRTFWHSRNGVYHCPCGHGSQDVGQPGGSRPDETGTHRCLYCGTPLDQYGVCALPDCQAFPEGENLHSHLAERRLCTDPMCWHNGDDFQAERQQHCRYCQYTAGLDGNCDDDQCPSHDLYFRPGNRLGGEEENRPGPGHWLVRDGLLHPDGNVTPLGERYSQWVRERMPEKPWPGASTRQEENRT